MSNFCAAFIDRQWFVRLFVHHELMRSRNQGKRLNTGSQVVVLAVATTNATSHFLNHIQTTSHTLSRMFVESQPPQVSGNSCAHNLFAVGPDDNHPVHCTSDGIHGSMLCSAEDLRNSQRPDVSFASFSIVLGPTCH